MSEEKKSAVRYFSKSADRSDRWIRPGDLLIMMTDGVLDMMEDGEERMAQVLEGLQEQNPQEIAEKILSYAICASEGRIRDDMTVFVLCLWENT